MKAIKRKKERKKERKVIVGYAAKNIRRENTAVCEQKTGEKGAGIMCCMNEV